MLIDWCLSSLEWRNFLTWCSKLWFWKGGRSRFEDLCFSAEPCLLLLGQLLLNVRRDILLIENSWSHWSWLCFLGLVWKGSPIETIDLSEDGFNAFPSLTSNALELFIPNRSDSNTFPRAYHNRSCKIAARVLLEFILLQAEVNEELTVLANILNRLGVGHLTLPDSLWDWDSVRTEEHSEREIDLDELDWRCEVQVPSYCLKYVSLCPYDLFLCEGLHTQEGNVMSCGASRILLAVFGREEDACESYELKELFACFRSLYIRNSRKVRIHQSNGMMNGAALQLDRVSNFTHPIHKNSPISEIPLLLWLVRSIGTFHSQHFVKNFLDTNFKTELFLQIVSQDVALRILQC